MNLLIIMRERSFIKCWHLLFLTLIFSSISSFAGWDIDFSRRAQSTKRISNDVANNSGKEKSIFEIIFQPQGIAKGGAYEIVVLHTEKGFIPSTINVQENRNYKIHVVNVNKGTKNVSFVFEAFSEYHSSYYGKLKTFHITPRERGVYTFQCPETSAQGKLVVYKSPGIKQKNLERIPASVE